MGRRNNMLGSRCVKTNGDECREAIRLVLAGRVQGLGVRPAIYRLATRLGLGGNVRNTPRGVEIEVEGRPRAIAAFVARLPGGLPRGAEVERWESRAVEPSGRDGFTILREPPDGALATRLPPDMGVCGECLREVDDPRDRRFRYPFTSCTACGPRYTIICRMPYERRDTTMAGFAFCAPCRDEYETPGERRFHAQTNACPACGPTVWAVDATRRLQARGEDAIRAASSLLRQGGIVALRGLGGYQLLVDATNDEAVRRLRQRKRRRGKPLAVLVAGLEEAARCAELDALERQTLADRRNPIVLLRPKAEAGLAPGVNSGLGTVGLMLPTTPLHFLLARDAARPLVCTSGNGEGEPLEYEVAAAERRLSGLCDLWLHHDRPIQRPVDDSVVRVIGGRVVTLRLARGLAPLPLDLPAIPPTLAVGGYLKAAVAWSNGTQCVLGPHIGDQESLASRERLLEQLGDWQQLYRFQPERLAHDLHPEYFSTQWAARQNRPCVAVQHHHAHVVAGMLEQGWLDRAVLGVAWDGTGYGADGHIWGGEFLLCTAEGFQRLGHLRPFRLPGGEAAIREPWRVAWSLASHLPEQAEKNWLRQRMGNARPEASLQRILDHPRFSPWSTSAGRLFDAAAALILGVEEPAFDGHAAMLLEAAADRGCAGSYDFPVQPGETFELDWRPLFAGVIRDCAAAVDPGAVAMRFHRAVAEGILRACRQTEDLPVVLGGGVFQNRLLIELILEISAKASQRFGLPGVIPPNDGGLAAGQLAVAAAKEPD